MHSAGASYSPARQGLHAQPYSRRKRSGCLTANRLLVVPKKFDEG